MEADAPAVPLGFFEVEQILDAKFSGRLGWRYLTLWKGYGRKDATWEPESSFSETTNALLHSSLERARVAAQNKIKPSRARDHPSEGSSSCQSAEKADANSTHELQILDAKWTSRHGWQFLILWEGHERRDAVWEPESSFTGATSNAALHILLKDAKANAKLKRKASGAVGLSQASRRQANTEYCESREEDPDALKSCSSLPRKALKLLSEAETFLQDGGDWEDEHWPDLGSVDLPVGGGEQAVQGLLTEIATQL